MKWSVESGRKRQLIKMALFALLLVAAAYYMVYYKMGAGVDRANLPPPKAS